MNDAAIAETETANREGAPEGAAYERRPITKMYRLAMAVSRPIVAGWGRLEVVGREVLPETGPLLIAGNHDSYYDTISAGVAALPRRQIQALAKEELWKFPGLAPVLDGMGQIPIKRGAGDSGAMDRAIAELRAGACIGIFPEGTRSKGEHLRAKSGFGRLAQAVPEAEIVLVAINGTTDFVRFPKRPSVRVEFFRPESGQRVAGESPGEMSARLLAEIRAKAPPAKPGRR